jgi:hypothetical protein
MKPDDHKGCQKRLGFTLYSPWPFCYYAILDIWADIYILILAGKAEESGRGAA